MQERRKFLRADYSTEVRWQSHTSHVRGVSVIPDVTKDISAGGIRLVSKEKLNVGEELHLEWLMPPLGIISLPGQVRWVAEVESVGEQRNIVQYHAGIEFLHIDDEERDAINEFVMRLDTL